MQDIYLKEINLPNFFILGAAKSGTTSLYHYLNQHPEIFMSRVKEPTFFCEDFQVVKNPITYFELFDNVKNEKVIGEASHAYLSDPKSPRILKALFPNAKFAIILRNPAERAHSLYLHMRKYNYEKIPTFESALQKEDSRFLSDEFKKSNPQSFYNFMYFRSGLYGEQIKRYFNFFNKDQFIILKMSDLEIDFALTLEKVFLFLGVSQNIKIENVIYNKGYSLKSQSLGELAKSKYFNYIFRKTGILNFNKRKSPKLRDSTFKFLMNKYRTDQELLFSLCGFNFIK